MSSSGKRFPKRKTRANENYKQLQPGVGFCVSWALTGVGANFPTAVLFGVGLDGCRLCSDISRCAKFKPNLKSHWVKEVLIFYFPSVSGTSLFFQINVCWYIVATSVTIWHLDICVSTSRGDSCVLFVTVDHWSQLQEAFPATNC